jgi:hypothetical protein
MNKDTTYISKQELHSSRQITYVIFLQTCQFRMNYGNETALLMKQYC